jgi:hypothetical protein
MTVSQKEIDAAVKSFTALGLDPYTPIVVLDIEAVMAAALKAAAATHEHESGG